MTTRLGLYSIPAWRPFADDLAVGLLRQYPDPVQLARVLVLLPTRRAVRALGDAFVRHCADGALLLPRMVPVGDIEAGDLADASLGAFASRLEGAAEAFPPIAPHARGLALAKILGGAFDLAAAEALSLAGKLANTLDTLEIEGKRAADIAAAAPEGELQVHWEKNARVLEAILRAWPELLAERKAMDATARRNLQLSALAAQWASAPPPNPVVMAGFASAPPVLAQLARVILRSEGCALVLPGFDDSLSDETWNSILGDADRAALETHPQFGMVRLLQQAGTTPAEVDRWPYLSDRQGAAEARAALAARAMQPPELCGARNEPASDAALQGLRLIEAANASEEALVIALALRQVVEHPGKTAALITPDRTLARRVTVQLKRFAIDIDDSAGTPLSATPQGSLLIALATAAGTRFAPVSLLALLQHPLVRGGEGRLEWLNRVRKLDLVALHGLRPPPGLQGVAARLVHRNADEDLQEWWAHEAAPPLAPLDALATNAELLLEQLKQVAGSLAGDALWAGDAGRALANLFEALQDCRDDLAKLPISPADAAAFITTLMAGETVRPRYARHPQLAIWGPLEARLQSADLIIMGGLNEGVWPGTPEPDPFLAPVIRRVLGLPGLARRTGLQAHDFVAGLGAPEVLLTRAAREGSAPSVPSRFWQRLLAAAGQMPDHGALTPPAEALLAVARGMDRAERPILYPRPEPKPPAASRPRRIRVTEVPQLKADPFAFYARHMLKLKALDPRDAEPTGGERGQVVHNILEEWLNGPRDRANIADLISEHLQTLGDRPELEILWRPRVERMVEFVISDIEASPDWVPHLAEVTGSLEWHGIELRGRADRIDRNGDTFRIVDYKTGTPPSIKEVAGLWQTQLGLLGAMLQAGKMEGLPEARVSALDYVKLSGGADSDKVSPALGKRASEQAVEEHIAAAFADYQDLVQAYLLGDRPFTAKINVVFGRQLKEFDHLARMAEWLDR